MALLEQLSQQMRESMAAEVEVGLGSIGLGIFTSDGRQVGTTVNVLGENIVEVTDGGETWSDLWMDGVVSASPTDSVRRKLDALCGGYGVRWDADKNVIKCAVAPARFSEAARRVAAASIAIDGWRAWLAEKEVGATYRAIIDRARELTEPHDWHVDENIYVRGHRFAHWRVNAMFQKRGKSAAVTFLEERTRDGAMQRMAGWVLDTELSLVFVAQEGIANDLIAEVAEYKRAAIVPRRKSGTPEMIVSAIETLAA